jgi:hypothetical protein
MRGDSGGEAAGLRRRGNHKGAGGQVTGTARVGSGEAPELIANDVSKWRGAMRMERNRDVILSGSHLYKFYRLLYVCVW